MREATAIAANPDASSKRGSTFESSRKPATNARGTKEAAVQITAGPIWSGSNPWMARACGIKIIVVTRKKRKKNSPVPSRIVSRLPEIRHVNKRIGAEQATHESAH